MTAAENLASVRRMLDALDEGDGTTAIQTYAEDAVLHPQPSPAFKASYHGHRGIIDNTKDTYRATNGTHALELIDLAASDDYAYLHYRESGIRNGRTMTAGRLLLILRMESGLAKEGWFLNDGESAAFWA
jgi:ketosteroid isomerase-like protein